MGFQPMLEYHPPNEPTKRNKTSASLKAKAVGCATVLHTRKPIDIGKLPTSGERNKAYIELATKLGASGPGRDMQPGEERRKQHIKQALTKPYKPWP